MNIGFDAKRAFHNKTGLGNYSRSLIGALDQYFLNDEYFLFTKQPANRAFINWSEQLANTKIITPGNNPFNVAWRSFSIPYLLDKFNCDIYHGLSAELPFGKSSKKIKYIVTIHDLIFLRLPNLYSFFNRNIYLQKTKYACKVADIIIAISNQTKNDLIQYLRIPEEKIRVVYQTCDPIFESSINTLDLELIKSKYQLPEHFILNVGTLEERKNAILILKSLKNVPDNIHAVFIGKATDYQKELLSFIHNNTLQNRVHFIHNVVFTDLPAIYQLAKIFVYPSKFEGFGIPLLEATKCSIPIIAATGSSLEEAGGENGIYIDPDDDISLSNNINKIFEDDQYRQFLIEKGNSHAAKFSAKKFASQTYEIYKDCF